VTYSEEDCRVLKNYLKYSSIHIQFGNSVKSVRFSTGVADLGYLFLAEMGGGLLKFTLFYTAMISQRQRTPALTQYVTPAVTSLDIEELTTWP
jgi:hypothetical protein